MNVAFGGSLYQVLPAQYRADGCAPLPHKQEKPYEIPTHAVQIEPLSLLYRLTGQEKLQVNSMHHQSTRTIAPCLRVAARAADGVVEALEYPELPFFLGVQWHPERLADEASQRLFKGFVNAASTYRRSKA